jgi:2-oxoglutarate ferredoxin oxidoreductase subunit alpha
MRIRVTDLPRNAPTETADVLLAVNPDALEHYQPVLRKGGLAIASEVSGVIEDSIAVPFFDLAVEHGGAPIYANAVAAGSLCAAVGLPLAVLEGVLAGTFAAKGEEVIRRNLASARAGFDAACSRLGERQATEIAARSERYAFVSAHETIPIAAAAAGCRFIAAYPMSPSTSIVTAFAKNPQLGAFAEQAEDEIAAINMALGASAAGARAMTATSGGGFALMVEAVSLAGMIETPIVILLAQRPGPAIRLTVRAFDLADRFQTPVLLLTDQYLADSRFSLAPLEAPEAPVFHLADPARMESYLRYRLTEDGVSPRLYLGQSEHLVVLDSDEHTEAGHITEDLAAVRPAMVEKRLEKGRRLSRVMAPPTSDGAEDADLVLMGWGSTKGAIDEAVAQLRADGRKAGALHFTEIWPLPDFPIREDARYFTIEGNATGQFATLLSTEAGLPIEGRIGRYDGLPITADRIVEALR